MKEEIINENVLQVRISKATSIVWEGEAVSVSSKNSDGKFDILGMHSNFITLISNDPIVVRTPDGNEKKFQFNKSVLSVSNNKVKIFSNIE